MLTDEAPVSVQPKSGSSWIRKVLSVEWLGQTAASLFWLVSMLVYGLSEIGDWLQLTAASAWLLANIAAVMSVRNE